MSDHCRPVRYSKLWEYVRANVCVQVIRSASDPPEGLVVTVAYDPSNPLGSSEDTLNSFECYEVAVKE